MDLAHQIPGHHSKLVESSIGSEHFEHVHGVKKTAGACARRGNDEGGQLVELLRAETGASQVDATLLEKAAEFLQQLHEGFGSDLAEELGIAEAFDLGLGHVERRCGRGLE